MSERERSCCARTWSGSLGGRVRKPACGAT